MERSLIKERVQRYGVQSLLDWELLSLLTNVNVENLQQFKNINDLRDKVELLEISDLQKQKIQAIFNITERIGKENVNRTKITSPADAYEYLKWEMCYLKKEEFRIILLDTKNNIIDVKTISVGSLNSSIVHPREVFKEAVLASCSSLILVHNHPSQNSEPSKEDISLTNRLCECGRLMGISILDHIIVGQNYYSFKEEGLI